MPVIARPSRRATASATAVSAAVLLAVAGLLAASPVLADDDDDTAAADVPGPAIITHIDQNRHFFDCFKLLVSDSPKHAKLCGPNDYEPDEQLAPTTGGGDGGDDD